MRHVFAKGTAVHVIHDTDDGGMESKAICGARFDDSDPQQSGPIRLSKGFDSLTHYLDADDVCIPCGLELIADHNIPSERIPDSFKTREDEWAKETGPPTIDEVMDGTDDLIGTGGRMDHVTATSLDEVKEMAERLAAGRRSANFGPADLNITVDPSTYDTLDAKRFSVATDTGAPPTFGESPASMDFTFETFDFDIDVADITVQHRAEKTAEDLGVMDENTMAVYGPDGEVSTMLFNGTVVQASPKVVLDAGGEVREVDPEAVEDVTLGAEVTVPLEDTELVNRD